MRRALVILSIGAVVGLAAQPASAQPVVACADLGCWQQLYGSECATAAASLEICLVFLQQLETARRRQVYSPDLALQNVALRIQDDIDYSLLQRALLDPESHLASLADSFATLCEKSIAAIVTLDECMAGLELAVARAEGPISAGSRRLLAEAALAGMRTIAGEALPASLIVQKRFRDWLDRLLLTAPEPVDVTVNLLEARADYTAMLLDRADVLLAATELTPNRGDVRLKLGATYVSLRLWPEALEQLRVARFFLPAEEHERIDRLEATADEAYQARFEPPGVPQ
jgi:hypothetical protein